MAQLNYFNGGLSTRLALHLIGVNEALIHTNIDISKGTILPLKTDKDEATTVGKSMVYFKNKWVYSANDVDYVIFQEKLYYSDATGIPQKSSDGVTFYNLGIAKAAFAPSVALVETGNLTGTYQYCYTYYNINDGSESMPSPYSAALVATADKVNVTVVASADPQVTNIRIYRLGGNLTVMSLVATITNTNQTYSDNLADTAIPADILVSSAYGQAPSGLKYLTKANAMFFGAIEDKLYFSEIAYVNAWSPYYFIDFDEPITAIGAVANGLIVCTEYTTHIITGTSPQTLSKYLLSSNQGCLVHKTMQFISNSLVWLSHDGLCATTGTDIQVITRAKLGKLSFLYPTAAIVYDDVYYLAHQDGMFVADLRFGSVFYNLTGTADCFHVKNNTLYYGLDNKLYSLFGGSNNRKVHYRSPNYPDGAISTIKNYKTIYAYSSGDLTITIYIDGKRVTSDNLVAGMQEVHIPQQSRLGYYIGFEVAGIGELIELEYKVEGRQNGR